MFATQYWAFQNIEHVREALKALGLKVLEWTKLRVKKKPIFGVTPGSLLSIIKNENKNLDFD